MGRLKGTRNDAWRGNPRRILLPGRILGNLVPSHPCPTQCGEEGWFRYRVVIHLSSARVPVPSEGFSFWDKCLRRQLLRRSDRSALGVFPRKLFDRLAAPVIPFNEPLGHLVTHVVADYLAHIAQPSLNRIIHPSAQAPGDARNVVLFGCIAKVGQISLSERDAIASQLRCGMRSPCYTSREIFVSAWIASRRLPTISRECRQQLLSSSSIEWSAEPSMKAPNAVTGFLVYPFVVIQLVKHDQDCTAADVMLANVFGVPMRWARVTAAKCRPVQWTDPARRNAGHHSS